MLYFSFLPEVMLLYSPLASDVTLYVAQLSTLSLVVGHKTHTHTAKINTTAKATSTSVVVMRLSAHAVLGKA
eukprot:m.221689 g.221689  ORF g.221689 m.221689 type:complete len:72 (-) comp15130_c0_seq2:112-327(-)